MKYIEPMDYATIISAKKMKGSGLKVGEEVFVVGNRMLPEKKKDPYLLRMYLIIVRLDENKIPLIPKDADDDNYAYLVDPRNLERFPDEKQEEYQNVLKEQRGETIH